MSAQQSPKRHTSGPNFLNSIRNVMEGGLDPTLVENPHRLLDALNRSDNYRLSRLLQRRDQRGYTLLHLAAERNQPESLKCLIIKDANPNICSTLSTNEVTPLHVAAGLGHLACLQLLVQSGGDVLFPDNQQRIPLDYARANGQDLCCNFLEEEIAKIQTVEAKEIEDVLTAVEEHIASDNIPSLSQRPLFNDLFPLSVSAGSNLTPSETLLYRRCEVNNSQELVRVLGRLSKDIPLRLHDTTILHAAARYGRCNLVSLLTDKVPQIALSVSSEGYNALHIAVTQHQLQVAKLLIEKQIKWSRKNRHLISSGSGNGGHTHTNGGHAHTNGGHAHTNGGHAHNAAAMLEGSGGIENSLSHGAARFATPTMSGHTVLHFAVAVSNTDSLFYLLKYHRELSLVVDSAECGYTPLHLAVFLNRAEAVKLLLQKGANPNARIEQSLATSLHICRTPLAEAALNKNVQVVHLLLEHGAEDREHEAIKKCVPYNRHSELVVPILASLVKHDDTYKPSHKEHRSRQKYVALEWGNLSLTDFLGPWVHTSLTKVAYMRSVENWRVTECVTLLNLSGNQLRTVPPEIFHLPKMVLLNLSGNYLEALPELVSKYCTTDDSYQWPCHALSRLNLSKNTLKALPEFLFSLPSLVHLDLSYNQLRELPFELWKAPKLHHLICSHNELESIPTNWPHVLQVCTVVDSTAAAGNSIEPPQTKKRTMSRLEGSPNKTRADGGPASLDKEEAKEDTNEAPLISKLHDHLNISNAHLPVDWEGAEGREEEYEGLAILNLSNNLIAEIPENFPCLCPKLVRLDLSHNKISSISLPRSFPSELKHVNLSFNQIDIIDCKNMMPKPLPCTNPQALYDARNTIYIDNVTFCTHRAHAHMLKLGVLEITNCSLQNINFFCPGPRPKQSESMNGKKSHETMAGSAPKPKPEPTTNSRLVCPLLTRLILSHNQLERVPESVCEMSSLNSLDLSHNDIIDLPAEMGNLSNLWEFPLAGLKLISPPQNIIERGKTKDIIGFLWSLLQRARPYHRMKLMLVGRAARGKTSLLAKISEKGQRGITDHWVNTRMKAPVSNISTVGIVVSDWTYFKRVRESQTALKSITFMTWDFGGQEEYYATHQCFLSRRSLYLAVWNVTHGMRGVEELKPWLLNIQARAPNSPVIIVGTHLDRVGRSGKQELTNCRDYIDYNYGSTMARKDGFPQIMGNIVVSCTKGTNIPILRDLIFDVASQVRENTVAGRGWCGRISEYRLLMDQLVPASYLQLEDTVRNIALNMRLANKPPVLTYKRLRNEVFSDPRTLISKSSGNRELEQAVRFLNDNGTMLHFEDPLLNDFYFVDPQWLCDMLAHIVTVREINPFIKDGIMHISDFPHVFNDMEFPIRWKLEYIRLLTTFEVAVELGEDQLLIPSALPQQRPNLPQVGLPEELKRLSPIRHTYIVPFIPSGFWPRLMSRLLTDNSIMELAREGCAVAMEDTDQLSWVKWRTGMILQYGNLNLLTVQELGRTMFTQTGRERKGIKVFAEEQWQEHNNRSPIFGIDIQTPDVYPILKFPEAKKKYRRVNSRPTSRGNHQERVGVVIHEPEVESRDNHVTHRMVSMDQLDTEFEKLRIRLDMSRSSHLTGGEGGAWEGPNGGARSRSPRLGRRGRGDKAGGGLRSYDRLTGQWSSSINSHSTAPSLHLPQPLMQTPQPSPYAPDHAQTTPPMSTIPHVSEEKNDKMRSGLLSKTIDHITLLIEDWFQGVRPRTLIVPCPHCSDGVPPPVRMQRSHSDVVELLPAAERAERGLEGVGDKNDEIQCSAAVLKSGVATYPPSDHPYASLSTGDSSSFYYAYRYNDCVVAARKYSSMYCPQHGPLPLEYIAPDTLFLTQGREILVDSKDLERKESVGRGGYATVYRANYKNGQEVALKALTKEWGPSTQEADEQEDQLQGEHPTSGSRPPSRRSIVNGFTSVRKELSILFPLSHPHVVKLFGVMLRPMGLVLELAPKGSLKHILTHYDEVHARLQARAIQRIILQTASAIEYLHNCSIIYRDLKSDNLLVWKFPEPGDHMPIALGSDLGQDSVQIKLSDYGISQFAATQGARGLVGTPGFIAPEILKYQGKEAYDQQVDLFSFGMFLYELLTLHIPYENLAIHQANQANEKGTRPSLSKGDFPCPVLVRELMVWCWQQLKDERPSAVDIAEVASKEQFPRLLDGIRICNLGQVTATCMRVVAPNQPHYHRRDSRLLSSPPSVGGAGLEQTSLNLSSQEMSSLPQLEVVSEEGRGSDNVFETRSGSSKDKHSVSSGELVLEGYTPPPPTHGANQDVTETSNIPSRYKSRRFLQRQASADDLLKRASPYYLLEEDCPMCEVWVSASNAKHATVSVIDYTQRFINLEELDVGDSSVLSLCLVRGKVWMGLEVGCLVVYDANTRKPYLQCWIQRYRKILAISHLPALHAVYVGLDDGSLLAYHDELPAQPLPSPDHAPNYPPLVSLPTIAQYKDGTQTSASILSLTRGGSEKTDEKRSDQSGKGLHELWVGQKGNRITILDASSLKVVKFLYNTLDHSVMPSYMTYLSCSHLVFGCTSERGVVGSGKGAGHEETVFSALYHGQYVTRWNVDARETVDSFNCRDYGASDDKDCSITALLYSRQELYVGLTSGLVLILDPFSFAPLCSLSCHRSCISSLLFLDYSTLQQQQQQQGHAPNPASMSGAGNRRDVAPPTSHNSGPSSGLSSDSPSPINITPTYRSSPLESQLSPAYSGNRLLSFGAGFKSYYDRAEGGQQKNSGFLLVWDAQDWGARTPTGKQ